VVSEKGQVTIPKALRDRLGIRPGEVLEFEEQEGRLVATKMTQQDPVDAAYGIITLDSTVDELIVAMRGEAELP
jgi:antitoxin PrlF